MSSPHRIRDDQTADSPAHPAPTPHAPRWWPVAFSGTVTAFFAYLAFRLSFRSLTTLARQHQVDPDIVWMFAILVDGASVVGTTGVITAKRAGRPTWGYWLVVLGGASVSLGFNIAHSDRTAAGICIAITPPLAQLIATEFLVSLLPAPDAVPTGEQVSRIEYLVQRAQQCEQAAAAQATGAATAATAAQGAAAAAAEQAGQIAQARVGEQLAALEGLADTATAAADRAATIVSGAHRAADEIIGRATGAVETATELESRINGYVQAATEAAAKTAEHAGRTRQNADRVGTLLDTAVETATQRAESAAGSANAAIDHVAGHASAAARDARAAATEATRADTAREAAQSAAADAERFARTASDSAAGAMEAAEQVLDVATTPPPAPEDNTYPPGSPHWVIYDTWTRLGHKLTQGPAQQALESAGLPNSPAQASRVLREVLTENPRLPQTRVTTP